jgi:hypothetical protein
LAGRVRLDLAPARYRFWSLQRYRYLVVYEVAARTLRIVRLVHMARGLRPLLAYLPDWPDDAENH